MQLIIILPFSNDKSFGVILLFGLIYLVQTIAPGKSGIQLVKEGEDDDKKFRMQETGQTSDGEKTYIIQEINSNEDGPKLLSFENGKIIINCIYFSLLSFATFGYGALRPRQWLELFRLNPVEYKPVGWARIFVGFEAAIGIYLLALTALVLFKG